MVLDTVNTLFFLFISTNKFLAKSNWCYLIYLILEIENNLR